MKLLLNKAKEKIRILLSQFLPNGDFWNAKRLQNTNLYKLINALSDEYKRVKDLLYSIVNNRYVDNTELLLEQWERDLQLPDECLPLADTINERQANILLKYTAKGVQTEDDFIELASKLGFTITITPLKQLAYPPYVVPFVPNSAPYNSFVAIIEGLNLNAGTDLPPYDVPFFPIGVNPQGLALQCVLEKLKPANVLFIYV